MEYKGYVAKIDFDEDADVFHGEVINTRDVITFGGRSVSELRKALRESVEEYLVFCEERGEEPEKPFAGRILLRIDPSVHREMYIRAIRADQSLNSWIADRLSAAVEGDADRPDVKEAV